MAFGRVGHPMKFGVRQTTAWFLYGGQPRRLRVVRWTAWLLWRAVVVLLLTVLAESSATLSVLALITPYFAIPAVVTTLFLGLVATTQRQLATTIRLLLCFAMLIAALYQTNRVAHGTPSWVRWEARPAVAALLKAYGDGPYPAGTTESPLHPTVTSALAETRCFYPRQEDSATFRITCSGTMFTYCTYDHRDRSWSTWDYRPYLDR